MDVPLSRADIILLVSLAVKTTYLIFKLKNIKKYFKVI